MGSSKVARGLLITSLSVLLGTTAGCWVPRGPIDLRDSETHVVRFGVDAPRGGICPGQPVTLDSTSSRAAGVAARADVVVKARAASTRCGASAAGDRAANS